jgi:hypothetical protein
MTDLDLQCPGSDAYDPSKMWLDDVDFYTKKPLIKAELMDKLYEEEFTFDRGKDGGGSSDGYYARYPSGPEGELYYIKNGGDEAGPCNKSAHAFNEVVTGSLYTGLHNRGLLAAPQQRIIIRKRDGTSNYAVGPKEWPESKDKPRLDGDRDFEILVGVMFQEGLDPETGHPDLEKIDPKADGKVKRIGEYFKEGSREGLDDLLESYFLDCLLGSSDTIRGNVFTMLPDTDVDKDGNYRPLKLFKLDFGNGLEYSASGLKKHNTRETSAKDTAVTYIGQKRGFWPSLGSPTEHIVDEFPGPNTGPGTMRIGLNKRGRGFSSMRAINLYGLISDDNILEYWKSRLGQGMILQRYGLIIHSILEHYYDIINLEEPLTYINSTPKKKHLESVLMHRLNQIYCILPKILETKAMDNRYKDENGVALLGTFYGGGKTRTHSKNKKTKTKTKKSLYSRNKKTKTRKRLPSKNKKTKRKTTRRLNNKK